MISGNQISRELQDALGLPKYTRGFTLRCYTGELVTVECEYYPDGSFQPALAQYKLVRSDDAPPVDHLHFDAWMRERTERAHAEFMERTSKRLQCDSLRYSPEEIARYFAAMPDDEQPDKSR